MNTNCSHASKTSLIPFCLLGGAVAASFIVTQPAQAQFIGANSQSRTSVAVSSTLSNGTTNNFASEIVFPENAISPNGQLSLRITYGPVNHDPSQAVITGVDLHAGSFNYTQNSIPSTVASAVARAIDAAIDNQRFGDIISLVRSWQSGGSAALD
jgi:hypothetical protein